VKRASHAILLLSVALLSGCQQRTPTANVGQKPGPAQQIATIASITDLSLHPLRFDGLLVLVRAKLVFGWEGDNFLFEPSVPPDLNMNSRLPASVWFYCKPGQERQVYGAIWRGDRPILGTFTGYFHFVPDQKSRRKDVFDPGPLQLEAIGISDLAPHNPYEYFR
jgi:hypothetical protein